MEPLEKLCMEDSVKYSIVINPSRTSHVLVPFNKPRNNNRGFISGFLNFFKTPFKRRLTEEIPPSPNSLHGDDGESLLMKRTRVEVDPDECLRLASLNPHECVLIMREHAAGILELKEEFLLRKESITSLFEGVSKSRVLVLGRIHTAFILLQPKSLTEFSVSNYDINFIIYEGESITLKTTDANNTRELKEESRTIESEPFQLLRGTSYALENHHLCETVLIRIFWTCCT